MQYRFAEFVLDAESETLSGPSGLLPLRRRAFRLLRTLLDHAPALTSRETILDEVWGHDALSPNVLPQTVSEIRQVLGDNAQAPRLIETRHRRGYRMMVAVERCDATVQTATDFAGDEGASIAGEPDARTPDAALVGIDALSVDTPPVSIDPVDFATRTPSAAVRMVRWVWIAVAVVAFGALVWRGFHSQSTTSEAPRPSLAILEGINAGGPAWLADAGTELLTVALSADDRLSLLRTDGRGSAHGNVSEHTSVTGDSRWQLWMREVLGADYALTGTWQAGSDDVSFDYALLRLDDGRVVLTGSLRGADLASLCGDVARDVRTHLKLIDPGSAWLADLPGQPDAREAYYRGLAALAQSEPGTAVAALEQAATDPQAGDRVHIALATAYRRSGRMVQAREQFARVLVSANEKLSVGERLRVEAEAALVNDRPADAAASLRALHRLAPQDVEVALALIDAQIRARQPDAAGATLTSISTLASGPNEDPRWHLAQARLAALRNDAPARRAAAEQALQLAKRFGRTSLAVEAGVELARVERADGDLPTARKHLETILAAQPPPALLAEVQAQLGSVLRDAGDFDGARQHLDAAQKLYGAEGNRSGELDVRIESHIIDSARGQSERAYRELMAMEPHVVELDDPAVLARFYNTLGVQAVRNDRVDDANTWLQRAATQSRRANEPTQEAGAYTNLAQVLARNQRYDDAGRMWERALAVFRDSGDQLGEAITLGNLGALASIQGHRQRARDLNRAAVELLRRIGASQHLARTAFNLGLAVERDGELAEAESLFAESLSTYRAAKGGDPIASVIAALARVELEMGKAATVRQLLDLSTADVAKLDNPLAKSMVEAAWGHLESFTGHLEESRTHHSLARDLRVAAKREDWQAMSDLDLFMLDLQAGTRAEAALAGAQRIVERFTRAGDISGAEQAIIVQATALIRLGRGAQAREILERGKALGAGQRNAGQDQRLDRLLILAGEDLPETRSASLDALATESERMGFRTLSWRSRLDALAVRGTTATSAEHATLHREIDSSGLAGLFDPLP